MVDSEYCRKDNKSPKCSIGAIMKNPELLKFRIVEFVRDHLKTKKTWKHAVKKVPFVIRYVPDRYKTQQMSDKAILENVGTLESVPDC